MIDDPHKIDEAISSPAARETVISWFDSTISTRRNHPGQGGIAVIGQRLHEHDLFGHLLAQGDWVHLCLPAEHDPTHPFLWPDDPRTEPGQPLWPARYNPATIAQIKRDLGSQNAAAQLQQRPAPPGGNIFKTHWWQWYNPLDPPPRFDQIIQSWDLNFGTSQNSDYVVGQVWGSIGANKYLLRQTRERLQFTETLAAIRDQTAWITDTYGQPGHAIVIEQAANGAAVIDVLRREIPGVIAEPPQGNKLHRVNATTPQIEAGDVYLPGAPNADHTSYDPTLTPRWIQDLIHETESFPNGANDDQIDALTQALRRLDMPSPRLRVLSSSPRPRSQRCNQIRGVVSER